MEDDRDRFLGRIGMWSLVASFAFLVMPWSQICRVLGFISFGLFLATIWVTTERAMVKSKYEPRRVEDIGKRDDDDYPDWDGSI